MGKRMVVHSASSIAEVRSSNRIRALLAHHRKLDVSPTFRRDKGERPGCATSSFRCM